MTRTQVRRSHPDRSRSSDVGARRVENHVPANLCALLDVKVKSNQAIEIRDGIESYCQPPQYSAFLNHLVPVFLKILDGNPVFISTSPEQVRLVTGPVTAS